MRILLTLLLAFAIFSVDTQLHAQDVVITIKQGDKDAEKKPEVETNQKPPFKGTRPSVDMAILLDTSNSMDGLISQAKSQLWTLVQQFAKAKKAGKTPSLRVSVFEYGNTKLPASENYIRQVVGLTDDLDKVSEALFGLTTQGGDEYCGQVIDEAITRLDWSENSDAYKVIFIAGNEPFSQGPMDYKKSCARAIGEGVIVNTIHCGDRSQGVSGKWEDAAKMAEGEFMNIDQDRKVVTIKTPHDKILIELNGRLNKTYMWYGKAEVRRRYGLNQKEQDDNAFEAQGYSGLSQRANVKGSGMYSNIGRDLVDSYNSDKKVLSEIEEDELPEALANLPAEKRAEAVQAMAAERAQIQKEIAEASRLQSKYIAENTLPTVGEEGEFTLGDAMQEAVVDQLKESGFEIEK